MDHLRRGEALYVRRSRAEARRLLRKGFQVLRWSFGPPMVDGVIADHGFFGVVVQCVLFYSVPAGEVVFAADGAAIQLGDEVDLILKAAIQRGLAG